MHTSSSRSFVTVASFGVMVLAWMIAFAPTPEGQQPINIFGTTQTATSYLTVRCSDGTSYCGNPMVDGATFGYGSSPVYPLGGAYMITRPSMTDNKVGVVALGPKGSMLAALETRTGTSAMDETAGAVKSLLVGPTGTAITPGNESNASAFLNMTTATTTQIVALASTQVILVSSYDLVFDGTSTVTFKYGTGTNCGTGTTAITAGYVLPAARGNGTGVLFTVPASNALCVTSSAAIPVGINVSYTQKVP